MLATGLSFSIITVGSINSSVIPTDKEWVIASRAESALSPFDSAIAR